MLDHDVRRPSVGEEGSASRATESGDTACRLPTVSQIANLVKGLPERGLSALVVDAWYAGHAASRLGGMWGSDLMCGGSVAGVACVVARELTPRVFRACRHWHHLGFAVATAHPPPLDTHADAMHRASLVLTEALKMAYRPEVGEVAIISDVDITPLVRLCGELGKRVTALRFRAAAEPERDARHGPSAASVAAFDLGTV